MDTDRKTTLIIAGGVLAAFATIAVLTSSSAPEADAYSAPAVVPANTANVRPQVPAVELVALPATTEVNVVSAGTPEEAEAFQVEPGVNYLARGIEAYQARNWDHAVAYLLAETDERPDRPYSQYLLGLSLWKAGRLDEAGETMRLATELDGAAVKSFINLSRIENDRGDYDAALQAALGGLALSPDHATALFLEGRSQRNLGDIAAAVTALRHSVDIDPDNGFVWNLLGLVQLERDQDAEAFDALQRAGELQPDVAYIQNNLGMALERHGDRSAAVAAYQRAVELQPEHHKATRNLARLEALVPVVPEAEEAIALGAPKTDGDEIR
jgi:tetratricopeptide (TPR) repeat protein